MATGEGGCENKAAKVLKDWKYYARSDFSQKIVCCDMLTYTHLPSLHMTEKLATNTYQFVKFLMTFEFYKIPNNQDQFKIKLWSKILVSLNYIFRSYKACIYFNMRRD